ncbi:MAG: hypothetical protein WKG01_15735 [Kofleriaceae bacterium]
MGKFCVFMLLVTACEAGDTVVIPDADPAAQLCTRAVYDNCNDDADCVSNDCHQYDDVQIRVCTQACSDASPCPNDASGAAAKCNNKGICKPTVANACRPE